MTNIFDDNDGTFLVLTNEENQHSLWPASIDVPSGWDKVHGPETRDSCLAYVDEHWTDMRPRSLADAMDEGDK